MDKDDSDDLSALAGQVSTMFRDAGVASLNRIREQKRAAQAKTFVDMLDRAEKSIAMVVGRLTGMNAELDEASAILAADEARAVEMARQIEGFNARHGDVEIDGRRLDLSMDAPAVLLDAQAAIRQALLFEYLLATATAGQAIAMRDDVAAKAFVDKLIDIARDEAIGALIPGIGLFLAFFNAARDALSETRRRAENTDETLADLEGLVARCERWREIVDEAGALLPRTA